MSNPRILLCDEISLGLAPIVVRDIYGIADWVVVNGINTGGDYQAAVTCCSELPRVSLEINRFS